MILIIGLGNPTKEYDKTRHNVGFDVIDYLGDCYNIDVSTKKFKAKCGKGMIDGEKVVLAKPQTYMNLSGESVRELLDFYKADIETEVIIIYDDIALDPGNIRIRKSGSAGGHNGIKSIISHAGTQNFYRIRVGVGEKPKGYDLADFVLGHFSKEEREQVEKSIQRTKEAISVLLQDGVDAAMNQFNKKIV